MSKIGILPLIFILLLITACNPTDNEEGKHSNQSNLAQNLSNRSDEHESLDINTNNLTNQDGIENEADLKEKVPNESPAETPDPETEKVRDQESLQQTIPKEEMKINLPFQDFKERWNAVTDQQLSNLYIKDLKKIENDSEPYYLSNLTNQLKIRVYTDGEYINSIELINNGTSDQDISSMLAGWSQIIDILHSNNDIHDVDQLFREIGVGPNHDLSNVNGTSIDYSNTRYEIEPTENGYLFRATYIQ